MLLTDFEKVIPGCNKLLPGRHVGPKRLGEEDNDGREPEHFSNREDELLGFLRHHVIHATHTSFKQH